MDFKSIMISSVSRKIVMGLTGLFLISFLVIHAGLNACIFANDGGNMFNKAAHFMGSNWVPRLLEIFLFLGFIVHIVQGYMLFLYNNSKRDIKYAVPYKVGSKWYSRSMAILGTIILLFLITHLAHFWIPSRFTGVDEIHIPIDSSIDQAASISVHNLFGLMQDTFSNFFIVIIYVLGCIALCYHLIHGFLSVFKTLGVYHKGFLKLLHCIGIVFSVIICTLFALMPICIYFGFVY